LHDTRQATEDVVAAMFPDEGTPGEQGVRLVDFDPDGEVKLVAAIAFASSHLSQADLEARAHRLTIDERRAVIEAYVGERVNRRHKPGRALERLHYRFDVVADYGAFRDLQRHRMLTIEWQPLTPQHGYVVPDAVVEAGMGEQFEAGMQRSADLYEAIAERFPAQAPYAVALAYRVRFTMQMNAREAMHVLELRTSPQGHPAYRQVCQEMHRLIAEEAGHRTLAAAMAYVDHGTYDLERLEAERAADARRRSS
jgi:hypothetical protein